MALPSQIESAARTPKPGISSGWSDHLVAMPAVERDKALLELDRARRAIERIATPEAAAEILQALGFIPYRYDPEPEPPAPEPEPDPPVTEKRCPRCKVVKPADQFYRHTAHRDGLSSYCKPCKQAANRAANRNRRTRRAEAAAQAERRETLAAAVAGRGYRTPRTTEKNGNQ